MPLNSDTYYKAWANNNCKAYWNLSFHQFLQSLLIYKK